MLLKRELYKGVSMDPNEALIQKFYQSFQDKNLHAMLECYDENVEFFDPVFLHLKGKEVFAMWSMLIERGTDLKVSYQNIRANEQGGSAEWTASYTFTKTNRLIKNRIKANFKIRNEKIVWHKDSFSLWKWAGMALGVSGYLLGFTSFIQDQIKNEAQTGLKLYMKRKKIQ